MRYFDRKGHLVCASVPLVPEGDPTLLFTSAGMVPFKPYYLGVKKGLSRAASCQKCLRTTDIDRVGTTIRHLTFFEMLGNFSFGDYFKAEAVSFAWEFLTKVVGLDPARLYPTVFREDDEAAEMWRSLGLHNPVTRLGEETNFWAMGPTGPCGPCSEIYYDLGADKSCGKPDCVVGCDCDRFMELWNLVFMQFERVENGLLRSLPSRNIDTGMGLERLAMVVEGKSDPFGTSLLLPIQDAASGILGVPLPGEGGGREEARRRLAFRVIADHSRAAALLAAEGILPSNVERGYILRRLIRRAARYGRLLGAREPFLSKLAGPALEVYAKAYPDLSSARAQIEAALHCEEERFLETLEKGEGELERILAARPQVIPGEAAFKLYDTFGFPIEMTREIALERGIEVDEAGFAGAQAAAAQTSRAGWKGPASMPSFSYEAVVAANPGIRCEFAGYSQASLKTRVSLVLPRAGAESRGAGELHPGEQGDLLLFKTPFCAECGGQVGDAGWIIDDVDEGRILAEVRDTQRPHPDLIVHRVAAKATLRPGMAVVARVDADRRRTTAFHHTATHLLNEALRRVLGTNVRQAGSLVAPDRLRFDFTHPRALTQEQLAEVEGIVNEAIREDLPVQAQTRPASDAQALKAVTLLGEYYGNNPRFVIVGRQGFENPAERFSLELCGGTHVERTGDIRNFRIVKESSVASGIRRIEAVAGPALELLRRQEEEALRRELADALRRCAELGKGIEALTGKPMNDRAGEAPDPAGAPIDEVRKALVSTRELERLFRSELDGIKRARLSTQARMGQVLLEVGPVRLAVQKFSDAQIQTLRSVSDQVKRTLGSGVVFLGAAEGGKLSFVVAVTQDLVGKGLDAGRIAREVAAVQQGRAGGRADFAQGGGPEADWETLVNKVKELVRLP
jgi:alanyl-tRNA synthetase